MSAVSLIHKRERIRPSALLWWSACLLVCMAASAGAGAAAQSTFADIASARGFSRHAPAYEALQEGRVADAAGLLSAALAENPSDSAAHQLLCRVYYAQDAADRAIHECELAVASPAGSNGQASQNQLWLGRAYGMKAEHAGPITGFMLARKVQASFARALELDSSNVDAIDNLGQYDVEAPSIVGGGDDKAQALANRVMPRFPGLGHLLLARLASQNKDLTRAESELKQVIGIEKSAGSWMDLADFYLSHKRTDDAVAAIHSGLALDRTHGPELVAAATILIAAHREPDLAERCLRDYLASRAKSDAAPAFKVHLQLGRLLASRGDQRKAQQEFEAAAALAPDFARRNASAAQGM